MRACVRIGVLASALWTLLGATAWAQDTLVFRNGDRLSGTLERIERGVVIFDAPAVDDEVRIGWESILRVESSRVFQFRLADGRAFIGALGTPLGDEMDVFVIEQQGERLVFPQSEIVYVAQTVGGGEGLLEANLGAGVTLAKSNDQRQVTGRGMIGYETPRFAVQAQFDSIVSRRRQGDNINRHSATGTLGVTVARRWRALLVSDFLTSEEQGLDRRVVIGGGPMRDVVINSLAEVRAFGGVVWNHEVYRDPSRDTPGDALEGLAGVTADVFKFKQIAFTTTFLAYPSISEGGRVRLDWRALLRFRLLQGHPFWFDISQSSTYDTRPSSSGSRVDYLTITSISWDFP